MCCYELTAFGCIIVQEEDAERALQEFLAKEEVGVCVCGCVVVCVCMAVCVCVVVWLCGCVVVCVCVVVWLYGCMCVWLYVCVVVWLCGCVVVCLCMCVWLYVCVVVCVCGCVVVWLWLYTCLHLRVPTFAFDSHIEIPLTKPPSGRIEKAEGRPRKAGRRAGCTAARSTSWFVACTLALCLIAQAVFIF